MLDLQQMTEEFIRDHFTRLCIEGLDDERVLCAINEREMKTDEREKHLLDWLHSYSVLRSFTTENSKLVAGEILNYADNERRSTQFLDKDGILTEYQKLKGVLSRSAPRTKSGELRGVESLTSKALWCCYPSSVPIIDKNARTALWVISRLSGIASVNGDEYAQFLEAWFKVYDKVAPVLDAADLKGYPYKVRVLDMLLWYLGQPSFDFTPHI